MLAALIDTQVLRGGSVSSESVALSSLEVSVDPLNENFLLTRPLHLSVHSKPVMAIYDHRLFGGTEDEQGWDLVAMDDTVTNGLFGVLL